MAANAKLKKGDIVKVVAVPSPGSGGSLPDWRVGDLAEVSRNDVDNKNMHVRFFRLKAERLVGWRYVEPCNPAGAAASGGSSGSQQAPTGSFSGSFRAPKATSSATASPGHSAPSRMTGGVQATRQHLLESAMRPQGLAADRRDAYGSGLHHREQPASAAASGLQCQGGASSGSSASASDPKMECLLKVATTLKQRNSDETDLFRLFSAADRRGEKTLSGDNFRRAINYLDPAVDDKTLRALFADFDRNGDGSIDQQEFRRGLAAASSSPGLADMAHGKVRALEGQAQPVRATAPMAGVGSTRGGQQWSSMPGGSMAPYAAPRLGAPTGVPKPQDQSPPPNPDMVAHESGSRRRSSSLGRLSPAKRPDELVFTSDHGSGRMPALDGGYDWIRRANGEEDRRLRQEAAMTTLAACQRGGYVFDGRQIQLDHVQYMTQQTRIVRASAAAAALRGTGNAAASGEVTAKLTPHSPGLAIEVACQRAQLNAKVALCSAASAYHAGGGFLDGGRHALEEAICMQSTLYKSLAVAEDLALREGVTVPSNVSRPGRWGEAWRCHIPEDGVILSPLVEVFRDGTASGYPFRDRTAKLTAVISMAMPNRNDRVRDAPVDVPRNWDEYRHILKQKFMAFLSAAVQSGAEELVLPDAGCGVYGNEPNEVGAIFGAVLREHFPSRFREIHLAGQPAFAQSFAQAATEAQASAPPLDSVTGSRAPAGSAAAAPAAPKPRGDEDLEVFRKMDLDRNGMISRWELAARLRQMDPRVWTQDRVETLLRRGKFNTNGEVAFEEFRKWTQEPKSEWYEVWRTLTTS